MGWQKCSGIKRSYLEFSVSQVRLMTLSILQNNQDSHELAETEQSQQLTQRI
ncbi:glycoprotein with ribonuclease inhibitor domain (yddK) (modular protein) [Shigella sonnei]|nr:glycoprotein with ribonuclease inhibitor domain (yddK) (modular protein) [Shigella sonnei]